AMCRTKTNPVPTWTTRRPRAAATARPSTPAPRPPTRRRARAALPTKATSRRPIPAGKTRAARTAASPRAAKTKPGRCAGRVRGGLAEFPYLREYLEYGKHVFDRNRSHRPADRAAPAGAARRTRLVAGRTGATLPG